MNKPPMFILSAQESGVDSRFEKRFRTERGKEPTAWIEAGTKRLNTRGGRLPQTRRWQ
ncbi:hypothetical protein [Nitrosococcus wardiae]|uniref:hypothetical protein n=1 Tax=Nitrosococcus wardiae TaxID=1814290 RepID=UPI00141B451F|nr:hypothetical protein [Nitrosococcus wardiae]